MLPRHTFRIAINFIRQKIGKDLPIQQLAMLLAIADRPRITMDELGEELGMPQGSVSRNTKALDAFLREPNAKEKAEGKTGKVEAGLGLVRREPDLVHRKKIALTLTAEGYRVIYALDQVLSGQKPE